MKKSLLFILSMGLSVSSALAQQALKLRADNIDEIIAAMTLEEKAEMLHGSGTFWDGPRKLRDTAGGPGGTNPIARLGIPETFFGDGPLGLRLNINRPYDSHNYYCTAFPSPVLVGSSWDDELNFALAKQIGEECAAYGVDVILGASINIHRNPQNGRGREYYSEDPLLAGRMGAAFSKAVESVGVGSSVKHFAANNQETNRGANNARISQRALREIYLKPFEIVVKEANPWTVMTSYNGINGKYTSENEELLEGVLRTDWGYKGVVMTDWGGGSDTPGRVIAGNDLIQPGKGGNGDDMTGINELVQAVKDGKVDEKLLDRNVKRVLEFVVKTHSFKNDPFNNEPDVKKGAQLARRVGAESAVLLKNNNEALPFNKNIKNVAMYGRAAYHIIPGGIAFMGVQSGNYLVSLVEGMRKAGYNLDEKLLALYPAPQHPIVVQATRAIPTEEEEKIPTPEELNAQVKNNDVAIMVLGHASGEGSDRKVADYYMTDKERELMTKVTNAYHAAGKKVVVILNHSAAVEMESWKDMPDAILLAYTGGEQMGNWLADLLSGKVTPSGKLTVTFAKDLKDYPSYGNFPYLTGDENDEISGMMANARQRFHIKPTVKADGVKNFDYSNYEEGIYVGYRYFDTFKKEVSYPFGFGLSYTTFEYSDAALTQNGDEVTVSVNVKNTGKYNGREVVQLYVAAPAGGLEKPAKELKGYAKTKSLKPGESQTLTMTVKAADLASFNEKKSQWETAAGTYKFMVAASSADIRETLTAKIKAQSTKVGNYLKPDMPLNELHQAKK